MVNSPLPQDLASECRKAAKIIDHFVKPEKGKGPDQLIPPDILANAKGVAILSVIKAGMLFSGRAGSGLVVARLDDGSWSAPSAIGTAGMGVGGQIGAQLTDFVIVLNTKDAVKAFSHGGNVTLGGNLSVAVGPLGRTAEAAGTAANFAAIYSYSKSKGLFAGVSIEGSCILERKDANSNFYHRKVSAKELLSGAIPPPPAAEDLYRALNRRAAARTSMIGAPVPTTAQAGQWPDKNTSYNNNNNPFAAGAAAGAGAAAASSYSNRISAQSSSSGYSGNTGYGAGNGGYGAGSYGGVPSNNVNRTSTMSTTSSTGIGTYPRAAPPPPPNRGSMSAVAMYDFTGEREGDLSFRKGDIIIITQKTQSQNDWWTGKCNGREGVFPANYVQMS
ncbi:hypothetical protein HK102_013529 [Quaeritorhiza haematococci]|nr:hypothetical protein HK102_013529 [Quaeritorhiza haematococci]